MKFKNFKIMYNFFQTKIRYDKTTDTGIIKTVTESFLVDAMSFTEAEARIIEEMKQFIGGEFSVSDISRFKVSEAFLNASGDRYYKVRLEFITLDEKSGGEKKQSVYMLVQASSIDEAKDIITSEMGKTMEDYNLSKIEETKITDCFLYGEN